MTNTFLNNLAVETSKTFTENGATAFNTTGSGSLLDLFAMSGSLRSRPADIPAKFLNAMAENKLLSAKLAFYTRDVRGGLGERDAGRIMFRAMAQRDPELMKLNMELIPEFGRWDDLLYLMGTPVEDVAVRMIREQLNKDIRDMKNGKPVSLLAKWMPSINTSSYETKRQAQELAERLEMTPRTYRKTLSALRAYLNVTEVRMTEKNYESIRYPEVPSNAMNIHRSAFRKNDGERFAEYLESVKKGDAKINSGTLYPYNIIEKYVDEVEKCAYPWSRPSYQNLQEDAVLEEQWKALPNYIEGENNFLIMADVSGSMAGRPMATSVGLAIYFAERNKGDYHNVFMTFSDDPTLVKISEGSLLDKTISVFKAGVDYSTNLEKAFDTILRTAVNNGTAQEDMPKSLIVITDGEINKLTRQSEWGFIDEMKARFEAAGYELPNVVLWNVDSRQDTFHASGLAENVQLCSGQSASIFKTLLGSIGMTPYEYMLSVLNSPRYDAVVDSERGKTQITSN